MTGKTSSVFLQIQQMCLDGKGAADMFQATTIFEKKYTYKKKTGEADPILQIVTCDIAYFPFLLTVFTLLH